MSRGNAQQTAVDLWLLAILAVACAARLLFVTDPLVDAFSWQQTVFADLARQIHVSLASLWQPRPAWAGGNVVPGPLPLPQLWLALWMTVAGDHTWVLRLSQVVLSVTLIVLIYFLVRQTAGIATARGAALFMACSPTLMYTGRGLFLENFALLAGAAALLLMERQQSERRFSPGAVAAGGLLFSAAAMSAVAGVVLILPLLAVYARRRCSARATMLVAVTGGVVAASWYLYVSTLGYPFAEWHWTLGDQWHYPPSLHVTLHTPVLDTGQDSRSILTGLGQFIETVWRYDLTPIGSVALILGMAASPREQRLRPLAWTWLAAACIGIWVSEMSGGASLPSHAGLIPPAALFVGMGAAPLFDRRVLLAHGLGTAVAVGTATLAACVLFAAKSAIVRDYYRHDLLQWSFVSMGIELQRHTGSDAVVLTILDGGTGPYGAQALYFGARKGWSIDVPSISVQALVLLKERQGLQHVLVGDWRYLVAVRPDVAAWLERFAAVASSQPGLRSRLFDLQTPVSTQTVATVS